MPAVLTKAVITSTTEINLQAIKVQVCYPTRTRHSAGQVFSDVIIYYLEKRVFFKDKSNELESL
jgi:hypothetical protein